MDDAWWRASWAPSPSEWQALWGLVTATIAGAAAYFALGQLQQNAKAALDQSRPFVVVDFRFRSGMVLIEVKNYGLTAARDISFKWDQCPVGDDERTNAAIQRQLVSDGIRFLAPGREIRFLLAKFTKSLTPRQFQVTAYYTGPGRDHPWDSHSVLDLDQWSNAIADSEHEQCLVREAKQQTAALKQIAKDLGKVQAALVPMSDWAASQPNVVQLAEQRRREHEETVARLRAKLESKSAFRPGED